MIFKNKSISLPKIKNKNIFLTNNNNKYKNNSNYKKINDKFDFKIKEKLKINLKCGLNMSLTKNKQQYLSLIKNKEEYLNIKKKLNISNNYLKNNEYKSKNFINKKNKKKRITQKKIYFINPLININKEYSIMIEKIKHIKMRPDTRVFSNLIYYDRCIFLFGGLNNMILNDLWVFNLQIKCWKKIVELQKFFYKNCLIFYDNKFYLFGGYQSFINSHTLNNNFYEISVLNNQLKFEEMDIKNQPPKKKDFGYDNINNYIFILGGKDDSNQIYNDFNIINIKIKKNFNTKINFFKEGIYGHSVTIISNQSTSVKNFRDYFTKNNNNKLKLKYYGIYVFGGKSNKEEYYKGLNIINFIENKINVEKPKTFGKEPEPRIFHKTHFLKNINLFIILGGFNFDINKDENQIFCLNLENLNWILLKNNENNLFNLHSFSSCLREDNDTIYVFGGYKNNKFSKSILQKLTIYND